MVMERWRKVPKVPSPMLHKTLAAGDARRMIELSFLALLLVSSGIGLLLAG